MPTQPIPLSPNSRFVLEGRVVTMAAAGVIEEGAICIEGPTIVAVQDAAAPLPPGFENAERIRTGDTLFPGLIELHNHLAYNAVPIWLVDRRFDNNGQWRNTAEYRHEVTKPAQVLGNAAGLPESVIRFAECRSLLGGTTTSQGITLIGSSVKDFFRGLVRNVEAPLVPGLPAARTRIANPPTSESAKAAYLRDQIEAPACYLQHLSEGVNATARSWFLRLRRQDGTWAIHDSFCGIHSTALTRADFDVIVAHGGSMVWSPLSNFLLYGSTADVAAMAASGIRIGLGSDWGPSGSKSLLGELKVAWLANQQAGGPFSARDLVRMATSDGAAIAGWDHAIGTLEAGKRADILAINGRPGDPFQQLIEARETGVTLVVIDGVPRVGQRNLMERFALDSPEEIRVGRSRRLLHLAQDDADELTRDLTLSEARDRLADALKRLPEVAETVGNGLLALLSGAEAGTGAARDLSPVRLELELSDEPLEFLAASLAQEVAPMELEGITVADDDTFLPKMVAAVNLPDFVKENLPGLYGEPVPGPFSTGAFMVGPITVPSRPNAGSATLERFSRETALLTRDDRRRIVDQALLLLSDHYVHLPFKRSMHAVDPVQRLRLMRYQIDELADHELPSDMEFHCELTRVFLSVRDLHTTYLRPMPFRGIVAWLPFMVEQYWWLGDGEHPPRYRFIISKTAADRRAEKLAGTEPLYWNGVPMETMIERLADLQAGANPPARRARALNSLTIRPLDQGLPPDEHWVTLRYRKDGREREARFHWRVFMPEPALRSLDQSVADAERAALVGLDGHTDLIQEAKKMLFAPDVWARERRSSLRAIIENVGAGGVPSGIPTTMPTVFRARVIPAKHGPLGHLRIFTFNVDDELEFVTEMGRLLRQLPETGLLIDVRGNGGGLIPAAEGALQLMADRPIEAQKAQFRNTHLNLRLCQRDVGSEEETGLARWIPSIQQAVRTGATYSSGFPLTNDAFLKGIDRQYFGPVAVISDALCYSATDLFVAGFQDHEIGPVIGIHENTGAGGANVWSYDLLRRIWGGDEEGTPYEPLPGGADFRIAIRRTLRGGINSGNVLEDLGVEPFLLHRVSRDDLTNDNRDLLECAAEALHSWRASRPDTERPA